MTAAQKQILALVAERQGAHGEHVINPRRAASLLDIRKALPDAGDKHDVVALWSDGLIEPLPRTHRQPRRFILTNKGLAVLAGACAA